MDHTHTHTKPTIHTCTQFNNPHNPFFNIHHWSNISLQKEKISEKSHFLIFHNLQLSMEESLFITFKKILPFFFLFSLSSLKKYLYVLVIDEIRLLKPRQPQQATYQTSRFVWRQIQCNVAVIGQWHWLGSKTLLTLHYTLPKNSPHKPI